MKGAGSAVCGARTCIAPGSQGQCRPNFFARTNRKNKGTAVEFLKMNDFGRFWQDGWVERAESATEVASY